MSTVAGPADASNRFVQNSSCSSMPRVSFSSSSGVSNCYVFKSRLQEYAEEVGILTPVYETRKEGPSHQPYFRSTVVLNDIQYDSLTGFLNRKGAEQWAANLELSNLERLIKTFLNLFMKQDCAKTCFRNMHKMQFHSICAVKKKFQVERLSSNDICVNIQNSSNVHGTFEERCST